MATILVTGATGTVGQQVVHALLKAKASFRVGVRDPKKAETLTSQGVGVVTFDYDKPETLAAAMQSVGTLFLLTPFVEDFRPHVQAAVGAAKTAGVGHIVRLSVVGADPNAPGPARLHAACDAIVKDSGIPYTLLLPTFFQDNVLNFAAGSIKAQGAIYGSAKDGKTSYVSALDIGKVAAKVLLAPAAHAGKGYVLTGPEALSESEVATIVAEITGKAVKYIDLPPDQYAAGMRSNHMPEWVIREMLALESIKANGWAAGIAPDIQAVLGEPATPMKTYLQANKHRLL